MAHLDSPLNPKQREAVRAVCEGLTHAEAYKRAGYTSPSKATASKCVTEIMAKPAAKAYAARLRRKADEAEIAAEGITVLTILEKRQFLARVVRARITELPDDSDLWQEVEISDDKEKRKLPSKLAAIAEDSKLAGDYEPEKVEVGGSLADILAALPRTHLPK